MNSQQPSPYSGTKGPIISRRMQVARANRAPVPDATPHDEGSGGEGDETAIPVGVSHVTVDQARWLGERLRKERDELDSLARLLDEHRNAVAPAQAAADRAGAVWTENDTEDAWSATETARRAAAQAEVRWRSTERRYEAARAAFATLLRAELAAVLEEHRGIATGETVPIDDLIDATAAAVESLRSLAVIVNAREADCETSTTIHRQVATQLGVNTYVPHRGREWASYRGQPASRGALLLALDRLDPTHREEIIQLVGMLPQLLRDLPRPPRPAVTDEESAT